jgi:hypothetical protein
MHSVPFVFIPVALFLAGAVGQDLPVQRDRQREAEVALGRMTSVDFMQLDVALKDLSKSNRLRVGLTERISDPNLPMWLTDHWTARNATNHGITEEHLQIEGSEDTHTTLVFIGRQESDDIDRIKRFLDKVKAGETPEHREILWMGQMGLCQRITEESLGTIGKQRAKQISEMFPPEGPK